METAIVCCVLLAILYFALSLTVSLTRAKQERGFGYDQDSSAWLSKVVRAHGNASEYIPLFILLIFVAGNEGAAPWGNWAYIAATASRYLHAAGMLSSSDLNKPNPLRFIGSLGTYLSGFALCVLIAMTLL